MSHLNVFTSEAPPCQSGNTMNRWGRAIMHFTNCAAIVAVEAAELLQKLRPGSSSPRGFWKSWFWWRTPRNTSARSPGVLEAQHHAEDELPAHGHQVPGHGSSVCAAARPNQARIHLPLKHCLRSAARGWSYAARRCSWSYGGRAGLQVPVLGRKPYFILPPGEEPNDLGHQFFLSNCATAGSHLHQFGKGSRRGGGQVG
jgi:hypothetical protein